MTPPPHAPLSETWTEQDERELKSYGRHGSPDDPRRSWTYRLACRFAREILRLRAVLADYESRMESELLLQREEIERLRGERDALRARFNEALQAAQDTSKVAHQAIESYRLNGREVVRLMSEQIVLEGVIAALRSELSSLRETPTPFMPDEERHEVWSDEGGHEISVTTREAADEYLAYWRRERPEYRWFLVRSTTSRTRVSDNG